MRRVWGAFGGIALIISMTACQSTGASRPSPTSTNGTPTATFTSVAEAQAAARATYARYLAASDEVLRDGGKGVDRIRPYVTAAEWAREVNTAKVIADRHIFLRGSTTIGPVRVRSADLATGEVTA